MKQIRTSLQRLTRSKPFRLLARYRAFQVLVPAAVIFFVYREGRREFARIDWNATFRMIRGMDPPALLLLGSFCLAAVASICGYDFILRRRYRAPIGRWATFRCAWIANTSNSVIGIAGLAGAGLRTYFYRRRGVPLPTVAAWVAFLSTMTVTGLSLLSWAAVLGAFPIGGLLNAHPWIRLIVWADALFLPLLVLIQRSRLLASWIHQDRKPVDWPTIAASIGVSALEWLMAGAAFWLVSVRLLPGLTAAQALGVYTVASVAGLVSMAPGGIGGFDLTALLGLSFLGRDAGASAAAVMLYRVLYYVVPWLIGLALAAFEWAAGRMAATAPAAPAPSGLAPKPLPDALTEPVTLPVWMTQAESGVWPEDMPGKIDSPPEDSPR